MSSSYTYERFMALKEEAERQRGSSVRIVSKQRDRLG